MSKKMMKRSLALGALMAFVITGSAMAAEETVLKIDATTNKNVNLQESGYDVVSIEGVAPYNTNAAHASSGTLSLTEIGKIVTDGQVKDVVFHAFSNSNVVISAQSIELTNFCNAFFAQRGSSLQVDAESIVLSTEQSSGAVIGAWGFDSKESGVTIIADNLTINAKNATAVSSREGSFDGSTGVKTGDDVFIDVEGNVDIDAKMGFYAYNGKAINQKASVGVSANYVDVDSTEAAVKADGFGKVSVDAATVELSNKGGAVAVHALNGSDVSITGNTIKITAEGDGADITAVKADNQNTDAAKAAQSKITIGTTGVSNIEITATSKAGEAQGIWATKKGGTVDAKASIIEVKGNSLKVNVEGKDNNGYVPVGIWAASNNENTSDANVPMVNVETANTTIDVKTTDGSNKAAAIMAMSKGIVNINSGNVYVTADNGKGDAVLARGGAVVNVGTTGKDTVLNGNVSFNYNAATSGSGIDATINAVFDGAKSSFTGMVYRNSDTTELTDANAAVTGMNISFTKGATWNLTGASIVNNATFGEGSNLVLKGEGTQFTKAGDFALEGVGTADVLTVEKGALITVEGMDKVTYNVATGFETITSDEYWTVVNDNALMKAVWNDKTKGDLLLEVSAKDASELTDTGATSEATSELIASITNAISNGTVDSDNSAQKAAANFINNLMKDNPAPEIIKQATDAAAKMAEAGGNNATAANIVKNVTGVTNDRLSFNCGHSAPHKGGNGVGLFEEGSGADIWVEYVHGKDKVEDMPSTAGATSYEGQFNGIVMGVDFKKVNKFQSGVAFNYGEGDTNSVGGVARTHSDYDFWGVGYYGNIHNDDSNVIFDINYAKTDSDVTQSNSGTTFEASPETTTWSAGVKLEKLYQNENVQIVPYTGLRYMSIDSDDYSTKCGAFNYSMDRQDIWLLPLGVSIRQEIANDNGWTVSPRVDLSYIWAFGDTNSNMEVKSPFSGVSQLGYDVMDDGSFLGLVGIEAHKGQWGYGVSYSYQKGDHSESKKWFVDVNYSF